MGFGVTATLKHSADDGDHGGSFRTLWRNPAKVLLPAIAGLALAMGYLANTTPLHTATTTPNPEAVLAMQTAASLREMRRAGTLLESHLLAERTSEFKEAETKAANARRKAGLDLPDGGGRSAKPPLSEPETALRAAQTATAEAKAHRDRIVHALEAGAGAQALPDAAQSDLLGGLGEKYAELARREAVLSAQLKGRHPDLIAARAELNAAKSQIEAALKKMAADAQSVLETARARENEIQAEVKKSAGQAAASAAAKAELRVLDEQVAIARARLQAEIARAKDARDNIAAQGPDSPVKAEPVTVPTPSGLPPWAVLGLGLAAGLSLGVAAALASHRRDDLVRSLSDVRSATGLAIVSAIPALSRSARRSVCRNTASDAIEASGFGSFLLALGRNDSKTVAHYRQGVLRLLARIKGLQRPGRPTTVMFVSPVAGAGNSVTTLALAYAAVRAGDRVLVVDATSAKPDVSEIFAAPMTPPAAAALDSKDGLGRITVADPATGIAVLPLARADLRTLKTAQRRRLVAAFNGVTQNYDLIFVDAGGVLEDEAAQCLLPAADQIYIVARSGGTDRPGLALTTEVLAAAADRIAGAVLTMTPG